MQEFKNSFLLNIIVNINEFSDFVRFSTNKMKGTVKFFNEVKEFGFITGEDGKDYFVHKTALANGESLDKEDKVSFEVEKGDRGPKAVKVTKE